jgi:hypothetical protein
MVRQPLYRAEISCLREREYIATADDPTKTTAVALPAIALSKVRLFCDGNAT